MKLFRISFKILVKFCLVHSTGVRSAMEYESLRSGRKNDDLTEEVSCCPTCQWTILHGALWYSWSFAGLLKITNDIWRATGVSRSLSSLTHTSMFVDLMTFCVNNRWFIVNLSTLMFQNVVGTSAVYPTITIFSGFWATTCTKETARTSSLKFTWISIS